MYGQVRCGKTERGVKHPKIDGFEKIGAYSNGPKKWKGMSPFLLGPFQVIDPISPNDYYPNGIHPGYVKTNDSQQMALVKRFENYWQGSKIYNIDVTNGVIQRSFFVRRAKMYGLDKAKRRAIPKAKGYPVAGYYNGIVMGYIDSRKMVYCRNYEFMVRRTPEYRDLYNLVAGGTNVLIVGPDGRDIPINKQSLTQAVNDPRYIFGHELVICSLLVGLRPWVDSDAGETPGIPIVPI